MAIRTSRPTVPRTSPSLTTVDGLAQLSFLVHDALERRAAEHGLSTVQSRLLGVLRERTPTMNQLAQLLELDKSSITGLVSRAERRGFVERTTSTSDRRVVEVHLTDAGRELVERLETDFDADVAALVKNLPSADRATLTALVSRVVVAHSAKHGIDLFVTLDPAKRPRR